MCDEDTLLHHCNGRFQDNDNRAEEDRLLENLSSINTDRKRGKYYKIPAESTHFYSNAGVEPPRYLLIAVIFLAVLWFAT